MGKEKMYTMEYNSTVCTGNKAMWQALANIRYNALFYLYCTKAGAENDPDNDDVLNQLDAFIDTME